jgi:hypothetical protein
MIRRRFTGFAPAVFLVLFAAAVPGRAEETIYRSASVASRWLSVPGSARVAGLAGAFAARGADPGALEANPAGLAGLRGWQALFTHNAWVGNMSVERLMGAASLGCLGAVAASVDYLNLGEGERYQLDAAGVPEAAGGYSSNSYAVGAAWAADFGHLALGAGLKGLAENVAGGSSAGFQGDLGLRWNFDNAWRLGAAAKNLGLDFSGAVRPISVRAGAGYTFRQWATPLALDGNLDYQPYDDEPPVFRLGAEWALSRMFILRGGYVAGNDRAPTGLTAGLGVLQGPLQVDYALVGAGELGLTHLVTLSVSGAGL